MQTSATGNRPAVTLIELVVVLTIIAILAGAIVPRMGGQLSRQNAVEAAARLALTCRTVRELAVARQQTCAVDLDLDRGAYAATVQSTSSGSTTWQAARSGWIKPQRLPENVKVASFRGADGTEVSAGQVSLRFFADGRCSGARIQLVSGEQTYEVVVHPQNGRVVYGQAGQVTLPPDRVDLGDG